MNFATKAIHAGQHPDATTGAVVPPIYQTSTYVQITPTENKGYHYTRGENPTRAALEENLAALENGKHGLCFGSGMAAVDAVMKLLKPGDEVIATHDLYGGTYRLFMEVYQAFGIKFHYVDLAEPKNIEAYLNSATKLVWLETPTNPLLNIIDIKAIVELVKTRKEILVTVDNTFATPYLQTPLDLGVNIVMHSVTKYLGGHSDVLMGALVVNDTDLHKKLAFIQNSCGAVPGPMDCFLVMRGIKTLHLRMERHCENAAAVANYLNDHPKVGDVYYPGLSTHAGHQVAAKQMKAFGGMVSFELKDDSVEESVKVMKRFKIFALAVSLGGVESLSAHPATMTHASIPKEERLKAGMKDSLIRLSVGVEDIEDLLVDLKQAIN